MTGQVCVCVWWWLWWEGAAGDMVASSASQLPVKSDEENRVKIKID